MLARGQRFVLVDHRPHTRRDGTTTELTVWRGPCAVSGEAFEQTAPHDGPSSPIQTCEQHRGQLKRGRCRPHRSARRSIWGVHSRVPTE